MTFKKSILTLILIGLITSGVFGSSLDLYQIRSCEIPGITKISDYAFGHGEGTNEPLILIRSGQQLLLYSISADSIIYEVILRDALDYKIALGDINKDDILDMIVAMSFDVSEKSDSAAVIELYNAGEVNPTEVVYFNNYDFEPFATYCSKNYKRFLIEALLVADNNVDDFESLTFSYKRELSYSMGDPENTYEYFGHIVIYSEFPNDTIGYSDDFFANPIFLDNGCNPVIIGSKHQAGYTIAMAPSSDSWLINSIVFYNFSENQFHHIHSAKSGRCAFSEDPSYTNKYDLLLCANIDPSTDQYEMLVNYHWWTACQRETFPYDSYHSASGNDNYYGWITGDYIEADTLEPSKYSLYAFHPDYPNTYFALADGNFKQFEAATNSELEILPTMPSGDLSWEYPDDSSNPYLISVIDNTIDIYGLFTPTSIDDDNPVLPVSLSLGPAMPNPFNASQTIPIRTSKPGVHLNVSVFNLLGERIDMLYDGILHDTEFELEWNASSFPSGIYFIRAQSGAEVSVIKSVLLK